MSDYEARLAELKSGLSEGIEEDAKSVLDGFGVGVPKGLTARAVLNEAARRAGMVTTFMRMNSWIDQSNLEEKMGELERHIREIATEEPKP